MCSEYHYFWFFFGRFKNIQKLNLCSAVFEYFWDVQRKTKSNGTQSSDLVHYAINVDSAISQHSNKCDLNSFLYYKPWSDSMQTILRWFIFDFAQNFPLASLNDQIALGWALSRSNWKLCGIHTHKKAQNTHKTMRRCFPNCIW